MQKIINMEDTEFNFNLDKMKAAVESTTVSIPTDALETFESFDKWLNDDLDIKHEK